MRTQVVCRAVVLLTLVSLPQAVFGVENPAIIRSEFIYETAPFPSCHASTIEQSHDGNLIVAWFGGTHEKNPDVGIWIAKQTDQGWTAPREIANGIQHRLVDGTVVRHPTWNPVLFQPKSGPLMLFYKAGPTPQTWWGMLTTSLDHGQTWSQPQRLPEGILGPVKNKPIQLSNGDILCATSRETPDTDLWQVYFEMTSDHGATWRRTKELNDGKSISAIQPSLLRIADHRLMAIGRSRQNKIFQVTSEDNGNTWNDMILGKLPNPNSGTDAITLQDGRHLIVYNHVPGTPGQWGGKRSPLNVAVSQDGMDWQAAMVLENEVNKEFSYPAVIQTKDGLLHFTYTWKRQRIKHVVVDPRKLTSRPMVDGQWPEGL